MLVARSGTPLALPGAHVPKPGFLHQILKLSAGLDRLLNFRRQLVRHVNREPPVASVSRKSVTAVAHTGRTGRTVLPNTGALPQRDRSSGNRPELLDGVQKPASDLFRRFTFGHRIGVILHLYKPVC